MHSNYKVNLEHYKVFYEVSLSGSMTKAAYKLFIGQPAVSKTIKTMEETLGVLLFVRSSKGLTLTAEGKVLFKHVSLAIEQIKLAENAIQNMNKCSSKPVTIEICAMVFKLLVLPNLTALFKIYNRSNYAISPTIDSFSSLKKLENKEIDCCIMSKPLETKDFKFINLYTFNDYLMATPEYVQKMIAKGDAFEKNATLISIMSGNIINSYEQLRLKKIHFENIMKVTSMEHTIALAKLNHGVGFVAEELVKEELANKKLVKIDVPFTHNKREVGFLLHKPTKIRKPLQNFIDYYADLYSPN